MPQPIYPPDPVNPGAVCGQPDNINYLKPTGFRLVCRRTPMMCLMVQQVAIPGLVFGETTQKSPFTDIKLPGSTMTFQDLVVTFTVDEDMRSWFEVWKWMKSLGPIENIPGIKPPREWFEDITLIILSSKNNPNLTFKFKDCWPKELSPVQMDTTVTDSQAMQISATFAYTAYDLENDGIPQVSPLPSVSNNPS